VIATTDAHERGRDGVMVGDEFYSAITEFENVTHSVDATPITHRIAV
jgi:hypothetical protein